MKSAIMVAGEEQPVAREGLWQSLSAQWPGLDGRTVAVNDPEARAASEGSPPAVLFVDPELLKAVIRPITRYLRWLTVPQAAELRVVAVAEIQYLQADHKYTTIATRSSTFLHTLSLKELQHRLDPEIFWRIHRSTIVNVSAIDTIYRSFRGSMEIRLKDRKELLPVSAAHARQFRQL